ncbi:MAG: 4-(cytidine 5'-diphospho)-2-C-methyl-D-erythritol kinase, partial [Deltaproteobacteria bacterium]
MHDRTYATEAPAKLNLRLKVVGRRTDGYHELVSLMVPVDLCDILEFQVIPKGIEIAWEGLPVPVDEHNLVRRAAAAFFDKSGASGGISVKVTKRIPVAAG